MLSHSHAQVYDECIDTRLDNVRKRFRAQVRYGGGRRWRGPWRELMFTAIADRDAFTHFRDTGALYKLRDLGG